MSSKAFDIQIPATEMQIAEAIRVADPESADTIRRLAFERDMLKSELDPPVCRLQFPDGSVPGNAREAAEGWKRLYDDLEKMVAKLFEQAKKCKNANATAMLLSVKNYLFDNYRSMEGVDELWQVADILCGTIDAKQPTCP